MKFRISKKELEDKFFLTGLTTIAHRDSLPDFITLEGEQVEEEDPLAEYSCGECIHYKTYEFCQCKCHKPAPQLPEEIGEIRVLSGADVVFRNKINSIIRYLKHHERN